jgi:hypothetical protein
MAVLNVVKLAEGWFDMGLKMEDISPLAAMISGKGGMGKAMRQGFGGIAPMMIARSGYRDAEEERQAREQAAAEQAAAEQAAAEGGMKKGGKVKKMAKGGSVGSASKRADGIATRGKTRGRMV